MKYKTIVKLISALSFQILICSMLFLFATPLIGQETQKVNKEFARGNFIQDIEIILMEGSIQKTATDEELEDFYNAFFIKPGTTFNPITTDLAMSRIVMQDHVKNAFYELYDSKIGSGTVNRSLKLIIYIKLLDKNEPTTTEKGVLSSKKLADFPVIYESGNTQFKFMLNGGLGNWVQGLDFRKVVGNGNIISHRIKLTSWITKSMALSLDYFYLESEQLNNLGGLHPIWNLKSNKLGQETSLTLKGMFKENYTILGIVSYATPGSGITEAFTDQTNNWLTVQAALFINF